MKAHLYDPTGNKTILVETPVPERERKSVAERLMALEPSAEQLGFLNLGGEDCDMALQMAGGEFCGNATMSAAAHFARQHRLTEGWVTVKVSGADRPLRVHIRQQGTDGTYVGSVYMPLPLGIEQVELGGYSLPLVRLPGISHLISDGILSREEAAGHIRDWCRTLGCDCLGVMLYERERERLTPLVYVPAVDTLFWENSCASGTAAMGAWKQHRQGGAVCGDFTEPAGILHVEADGETLMLRGTVRQEKEIMI